MAEKVDKKIIEKLMNGKNAEFTPKFHKIQKKINDGIIEMEKHFSENGSQLQNQLKATHKANRKGEYVLIFLIISSVAYLFIAHSIDKTIYDLSVNELFKDKWVLLFTPMFAIIGFFSILSYIACLVNKNFTFKVSDLVPNLVAIAQNMKFDFMGLPIENIKIIKKGKNFNSEYKKRLRKTAYIMLKYNKLVDLYDELLKNQNSP